MSLPVPNLDDRTFQQLVDEAKRRIPTYCPQWTDHNVSDPGITLIELFAWMTEQFLFRLNQVPEKNYLTFLDMIGVQLGSARAARGEVTFEISAPPTSERRIIILARTEVATERTETDEAVVFTTDTEVEVQPATLQWLLSGVDRTRYQENGWEPAAASFEAWPNFPVPNPTEGLYLGFKEDLSNHLVVLDLECYLPGLSKGTNSPINTNNPPWRWQVWGREADWQTLPIDTYIDTTDGFSRNGKVCFFLPAQCQPLRLRQYEARTWLRCLPLDQPPDGEKKYERTPNLKLLTAYTGGITLPVTHTSYIDNEILGISDGLPGQRFRLRWPGVLELNPKEEVLEVENEERDGWESWYAVPDFGDSRAENKHFRLDSASGQIEFGPAIRQTDRTLRQFGAIPSRDRVIKMRSYRIGGGTGGNVAPERVRVLKSTLPYISRVYNRQAITGGEEPQTIEDAKLKGRARLRARYRAVTADDWEALSQEVEGVGRVRCVPPLSDHDNPDSQAPLAGGVRLLVIPGQPELSEAELARHIELHDRLQHENHKREAMALIRSELKLPDSTRQRLTRFLDERRLVTTRFGIDEPEYTWLMIQVRIRPGVRHEAERVRRAVRATLYRFLHPLYGGTDGRGWPFGREVSVDKIYSLIQRVPGVEYTRDLILNRFIINEQDEHIPVEAEEVIEVSRNGLVLSYRHVVSLIEAL